MLYLWSSSAGWGVKKAAAIQKNVRSYFLNPLFFRSALSSSDILEALPLLTSSRALPFAY